MGFEALSGGCEHCKSEHRKKGDDLKVLTDPNVSKKTETIDVFTRGTDNSINGIHKKLGFPFFQYRTVICGNCLVIYETTDALFNELNSESSRMWNHEYHGFPPDLQVTQILIIHLDRGKNKYKILTKSRIAG